MNLSARFKTYLLSQKHPASKATVKNYLSDVNRFISWFEAKFGRSFDPNDISSELINSFKSESLSSYSASSVERSLSSLRKFFTFLSLEKHISKNPFDEVSIENETDPWRIKDYKNYLFLLNSSPLTIKNYIVDLKQFIGWLEATTPSADKTISELSYLIYNIDSRLISDYKTRLLENLRLSPTSVNRKLSSLRSYVSWAQEQGIIKTDDEINIINEPKTTMPLILPASDIPEPKKSYEKSFETYSSFPPIRLIQKSKKGAELIFDAILIAPLALGLAKLDELIWIAKGKPVFDDKSTKSPIANILEPLQPPSGPVRNIPKSYYAPTHISVANFPLHKKIWHNIRYTRPEWYKKYHTYTFVSYLHFSILMLVVLIFGYIIFLNADDKNKSTAVLGAVAAGPDRTLTFKGRLTDENGNSIEAGTNLRMSIYSSEQSSGSALLWQELVFATPNNNGIFSIVLGENSPLPQNLFYQNPALWLGVTVENTTELSPRQPIATVAYAQNTDTIQGLPPITNSRSNTNVLLALNSSGNLTIGGAASPVFQATGGRFTLSGKVLALTTTNGSNGDIRISPNGAGVVDIQKVIKNTSKNNNIIPGAVQIDDVLVLNESSLGSALLNINQGSTGDLVVASVSGATKFLVDNAGNVTAGGSFNGLSISSGTITIGTWNGAIIESEYGGTGLNTSGSTGIPFISSGTWSVDSNHLSVSHGGTGISSYSTGDILYADGSESLAKLGIGASGNCLISNGNVPVWETCATNSSSTNWSSGLGTVFPLNSTQDILIGGQSTSSAKFAILNVNSARGNQTASISGKITLDSNSASIETVNNQALTIGGNTTGDIKINNNLGGTFTTFDTVNNTVGIGISLPEAGLHITRPLSFETTGKALVILDQTENQDVLAASASGTTIFRVANNGTVELSLATAGTTNDAVCWDNSGSSLLYDCDSTPADYAESYPVDKNVVYGEIVMVTDEIVKTKIGTNVPRLTKATNNKNAKILGVTSDNWHDFTSAGKEEIASRDNPMPVALNGRVLTKVTAENGEIKIGDPITASSIPGIGMKSTKPEKVVGTALEPYSSKDPSETGEILVFINPTWYDPVIMFASDPNGLTLSEAENTYKVQYYGSTLEKLGAYSELFVANLKAGYLELGRLTVTSSQIAFASIGELSTNSLAIATENVTIAGTSLRNYIYSIVDERIGSQQVALASPILETDIIKPRNGNNIAVELPTTDSNSSFEITNASGSAVASIDGSGNASFSGRLSSNEIQTSDASVSGTLRADRIVADQIDLSDNALSVLQNSISSTPAITNNYYYNSFDNETKPSYPNGTGSATLASITAGVGTFTNGLISFGDTSFYDATIANRLFVGAQLSIADQSINVLGANLKIQSLGQGGVDFLEGKIVIDTDGNLNVNGNAYFAKNVDINGKLAAGIISPLPGKGLVFQFDDQESTVPNIEFRSGTGSAVLSFNNKGDISSSGSGTFNKLNLNIIPEAIAVSDTEVIATGSAGTAEIKPYKNELTIKNPLVTKGSLIYITPKTSVSNQSIYLLRQVDGESFTVGLSRVVNKSVPFNWILIN